MDTPTTTPTFKDEHREFQEFARELAIFVGHNHGVFDGLTVLPLRVYPQLALGFVALERFLRILPGVEVNADDTLKNLLERAAGRRLGLLAIEDRAATIDRVNAERVAFMHGRLPRGTADRATMTARARFADDLTMFVDGLLLQIDVGSATRKPNAAPARLAASRRRLPATASFLSPEEELAQLRTHNKGAADHGAHSDILLLAEGSLTIVMLERICRRLSGSRVGVDDSFRVVAERTLLDPTAPVQLVAEDPVDSVARMVRVRNSLVHANYEQIVESLGLSDIAEYFRSSQYISEIERLHHLYNQLNNVFESRSRRAARTWRRG